MLFDSPIAFANSPLDRANLRRKDEAWITEQERDPRALLLILYQGELLIERGAETSAIMWLGMDALSSVAPGATSVFLGLWDGRPIFAADCSAASEAPFSDLGSYAPIRAAAPYLPPKELSVVGQAQWILAWHAKTRFCTVDGGSLTSKEGGTKLVNEQTGVEHFPRTDPVSIVLPYKDDKVCLGRGVNFPGPFMSAFAGFLEAGESLEACGARELQEEVGLVATTMEYRFSQPWPFPASLMVGFLAEVEAFELQLDPDEIADARWFDRSELMQIMNGEHEIMAPPRFALAHHLMTDWLAR